MLDTLHGMPDPPTFWYVIAAVRLVARVGWRLLPDYRFDPTTGLWHHRRGPVEPPLRLRDITYAADGTMAYPRHTTTAPVSALADYLVAAQHILASADPPDLSATAHLGAEFDRLRWFELPASCLDPA